MPLYYRQNVIGGPNSFLLVVQDFNSFADAMAQKLAKEIDVAGRAGERGYCCWGCVRSLWPGVQEDVKVSDFAQGRRDLLRSAVVWVATAAGFASARSAGAWQVEEIAPESPLGLAYSHRCDGASSDHAALVAQLREQLAKEPATSSLAMKCPICGCSVIVSR